jgi:hypothetical protein
MELEQTVLFLDQSRCYVFARLLERCFEFENM